MAPSAGWAILGTLSVAGEPAASTPCDCATLGTNGPDQHFLSVRRQLAVPRVSRQQTVPTFPEQSPTQLCLLSSETFRCLVVLGLRRCDRTTPSGSRSFGNC